MLSLFEFAHLIHYNETLIEFLIHQGVAVGTAKCKNCGNDVNLNKETLIYQCRKRYFVKNVHKKRVSKQCHFTRSVRTGTWFDKSHLDVATVCKIVACFLMLRHPRHDDTQDETNVSPSTIIDWFGHCREICVYWAEKYSEKLGGPGCTVEIDEAKIGRQKYNRGRLEEGLNWIFGGYEQESKKIFIVPVKNRTEETLLTCIKEWIEPETTIVLYRWESYNLNSEGFQNLKISHSYNFVDPQTGTYIQHIERVWREVRGNIPRYGTRSDHVIGYLSEYLFKRAYNRLERIEIFFDVIGKLYPPISISENQPEWSDQNTKNTNINTGEHAGR